MIITKYNDIINNISCNLEDNVNKFAFTLAEVLITLGIIGVVAALTIPALVGKYEIYVRQQQFKKAYSVLETALQKAQYDLGGFPKCYYGLDSDATQGFKWGECQLLFDTIANNFKTVKKCENNALANGCLPPSSYKGNTRGGCPGFSSEAIEQKAPAYILNDGIIMLSYSEGTATTTAPIVAIDINGKKGPNKWGHDVFAFSFVKENKTTGIRISPMASGTCQLIEDGGKSAYDYWLLMNKGVSRF